MFIASLKPLFSLFKSLFISCVFLITVFFQVTLIHAEENSLVVDVDKSLMMNELVIFNQGRVAANAEKLDANVKSIKESKGKVSNNVKGIEANKGKITNNKKGIGVNKKNILTNSKSVKNNQVNIKSNKNNISDINRTLQVINDNLKNKTESILVNENEMKENRADIDTISNEISDFGKATRANTTDIASQKSLTEENSIRLYEILIKSSENEKILDRMSVSIEGVKVSQSSAPQNKEKRIIKDLNRLWVILAIILVSFAPFAFMLMSKPTIQHNVVESTSTNNGNDVMLIWLAAFLGYFIVGFSLMYGTSASGWIGSISLAGMSSESAGGLVAGRPYLEFILYQSSFAVLFALLVHFMLSQHLQQRSHVLIALLIGMVIFPVLGHWVWAGHFFHGNQGWLQSIGFIDVGGATIIHSAAAWFVLIIAWKLNDSETVKQEMTAGNAPLYSGISICLLWLAVVGFNTGLLSISSQELIKTILNIALAAGSAAMTLFLYHAFVKNNAETTPLPLCGFVSGLVAISAVSTMVTPLEAIIVGVVAALVQHISLTLLKSTLLKKEEQSRVAILVSVHGFAGVWGTLSVALLGTDGRFGVVDVTQLSTQGIGIAAILVYSVVFAWVIVSVFALYQKFSRMNALLNDGTDRINERTN